MKRGLLIFGVAGVVVFLSLGVGRTQMIDYQRRNKMLKGIDQQPASTTESNASSAKTASSMQLPQWMSKMPAAETATESRYDVNRDGYLQTAETKIFLRSVIDDVEDSGGYVIDSGILREYDENKDGMINRFELPALKRDTRS